MFEHSTPFSGVSVDELNARGVSTRVHDSPHLPTDDRGVLRGRAHGRAPDIAWFLDPAGTVLSVLHND